MASARSLLRLDAVPASTDVGLLVLRLWAGLSMLALHGQGKLSGVLAGNREFSDPIGLGTVPSLFAATAAEFFASVLIIIGLGTRWAALALGFTMAVAFFTVHGGALTGEGNGEKAFLYLGFYVVLFLTGAGRYSVDGQLKS